MKYRWILYILLPLNIVAQQMPDFTLFRNNLVRLNPGVCGTKRLVDVRLNYHKQWVGFEGAPTTMTASVNSRFLKGFMGAGGYVVSDATGPTKRTSFGADYAFHIRFPDVELSFGVSGGATQYWIDGSLMNVHNSGDKAIDNAYSGSITIPNASTGVYFYNDRFHLGLSALNFIPSKVKFYEGVVDSVKKIDFPLAMHNFLSIGYNYSTNYDFIYQNSLFAYFVNGAPFALGYNLTLRIKEKILAGATFRFGDAIGLNVGYTLSDSFEVHYAYDYIYSKLSAGTSGTHEVMLVFSWDKGSKRNRSEGFKHQKYRYMF